MKYVVIFRKSAVAVLNKYPISLQEKIFSKINQLVDNPLPIGVKKIRYQKTDLYRIRIGNYHVIYEINRTYYFSFKSWT